MGAVATLIGHGFVWLCSAIPWIGWFASFLVYPVYYGYDRYFLLLVRRQPQPLSSLFIGFKPADFWRSMWAYTTAMAFILLWYCTLLMPMVFFFSLYSQIGNIALENPMTAPTEIWREAMLNMTSVHWSPFSLIVLGFWSVLLSVPGFLALARYSMIGMIILDRPDLGALKILSESAKITSGHQWKILRLTFSFIGWAFLASLTGGLGFLWLSAYYRTALSHLYEDIKP